MLIRSLAQGLPDVANVHGQVTLFDERVRPDALHQGILGNKFPWALYQREQRFKRSPRKRDNVVGAQEQSADRVEPKGAEPIKSSLPPRHERVQESLRDLNDVPGDGKREPTGRPRNRDRDVLTRLAPSTKCAECSA